MASFRTKFKSQSSRWARFTDDTLHEPCSSQDLVEAFNRRDVDEVKKVLTENPGALHQTAFYWMKQPSDKHIPPMSAAEVAVQMDWAAVLPVLHDAGDRFDKPRATGALHMATKKQKSGCANKLLRLGASLEQDKDGLAPIVHLELRMVLFEKNKAMRSIGRGYIRAGQDPWAETGRGLAILRLLKKSAFAVVIDMLADQVKKSNKAPETLDRHVFWACVAEGARPIFNHQSLRAVVSHIKPLVEMVELAAQVGLAPGVQDLRELGELVSERMDAPHNQPLRNDYRTQLMTGFASVGIAMCKTMDDERAGFEYLLEMLAPYQQWVDPMLVAQYSSQALFQGTSQASQAPRTRGAMRF